MSDRMTELDLVVGSMFTTRPDEDRDLFEELRVLRLEIARRRRVPPYVIFHDTTLREIARLKPKSVEELRHVYGVGDRKAGDLGELILAVVARSS